MAVTGQIGDADVRLDNAAEEATMQKILDTLRDMNSMGSGGGGAGDQDSDQGGSGGKGGGIVMITSYGNITGAGQIESNGQEGENSNPNNEQVFFGKKGNDGAGGGGSGARGGQGSSNGGGGGASGYTSLTLLSSNTLPNGTQQGGNNDVAFISVEAYSVSDDQEPLIPPASGLPQAAERTVTWNVTRNAGDNNTVTFTRQSGTGPNNITFGPNGETKTSQISSGAVYTRTSSTASGGRGLSFRLNGNRLELDDRFDNDFNDLTVTPDQGRFTSDSRWEANW